MRRARERTALRGLPDEIHAELSHYVKTTRASACRRRLARALARALK